MWLYHIFSISEFSICLILWLAGAFCLLCFRQVVLFKRDHGYQIPQSLSSLRMLTCCFYKKMKTWPMILSGIIRCFRPLQTCCFVSKGFLAPRASLSFVCVLTTRTWGLSSYRSSSTHYSVVISPPVPWVRPCFILYSSNTRKTSS